MLDLAEVTGALEARLGYQELRSQQSELLEAVFLGKDCLAVMPTGSGKSIGFIAPAMLRPGLVLVVSPLISLMHDQVRRIRDMGVECLAFDSGQNYEQRKDSWARLNDGQLKILFISPERLAQESFRNKLRQAARIQLVAIDEAHCISQWGSHFRPDYRRIDEYLQSFGPIQKLALTATATAEVRRDIVHRLSLVEPELIDGGCLRDNLEIKVVRSRKVDEQLTLVLHSVKNETDAGIVYAATRKKVDELYKMLADAGESVVRYHAGMSPQARSKAQSEFLNGKARVAVATNAFGMGIDKGDIRFVFHAGLPGSLEHYVQEIGRAGRDGESARCWLFYGPRDYFIQKFLVEQSFPDRSLVREVYLETLRLISEFQINDERELGSSLLQKADNDERKLKTILFMLYREGLLERQLPDQHAMSMGVEGASVKPGCANSESFFDGYDTRMERQLGKLADMLSYVKNEGTPESFIDDYFGRREIGEACE